MHTSFFARIQYAHFAIFCVDCESESVLEGLESVDNRPLCKCGA